MGGHTAAKSSTASGDDATRATSRRTRRWAVPKMAVGIAVIFLAGISLVMYPTVASWFSQYNQSRAIEQYSGRVLNIPPAQRARALELADEYNQAIRDGQAVVGANERIPSSSGSDQALIYDEMLAADAAGLMARIKIPAIGVDLPVYHGTDDETLHKGVGHLEGTALPVGGDSTHSVLTGHRGLANATIFTNLDRVGIGDRFVIEVFGEVVTYQVIETQVVEPQDTQTLLVQPGRDLMTLVTCTPLGVNSHRILVTGERISPTPDGDLQAIGRAPEVPHFPWWAVILGGAILLLSLYVWWSGRIRPLPNKTVSPVAES